MSGARWQNQWIVVDGTDTAYVFERDGRFIAAIHLPNFAFVVDSRGNAVWFYNAIGVSTTWRLWWSTALPQLTPVKMPLVDETLYSRDRLLAASAVMSACGDGAIAFAHVIGK